MLYLLMVIILLLVALLLMYLPPKRQRLISSIIDDLQVLRTTLDQSGRYALQENILFFRCTRHPVSYLWWQLFHAPSIKADKLLELADFPLKKWQAKLYEELEALEKKPFPGLLKPLRTYLAKSDASTFLDLGCGPMEAERQLILKLRRVKANKPRVFIGVDNSDVAYTKILENFKELKDEVRIAQVAEIREGDLEKFIERVQRGRKHQVLFLKDNALDVASVRVKEKIDLVFSSKFKHHLKASEKRKMDQISLKIGKHVIEFDDYRTGLSWLPPLITAWMKPVLLNGALLSRLRQPSKSELIGLQKAGQIISFYNPPGSYIKVVENTP